ncbi:MAG: hypothetical protein IJ928_03980 [Prevotella sp.]|nr:hypothetical protein [Prevotella sp.]
MKKFNFETQTAEKISQIKKDAKQFSNQPTIVEKYTKVLEDTQFAIDNIVDCITNRSVLRKVYIDFSNGDVSFLDALLGLDERGENGSRYRDFLTLDEANIVGMRVADHFETINSTLDNANNKVTYLMQVVLIQTPPKPEAGDAIKSHQTVSHTKVLTQGYVDSGRNWNNLVKLLKTLADYLTCADYTNDSMVSSGEKEIITCKTNINMNKKLIRLTESDLHRIVKESVKKIIKEEVINHGV